MKATNAPVLTPLPSPEPPSGLGRLPLGRWFLLIGMLALLAFGMTAGFTVRALEDARHARDTLVDVVDPAAMHTLEMATALQTQEGAIRGYGITNEQTYLQSYLDGLAEERRAAGQIRDLLPRLPDRTDIEAGLKRLTAAADAWRVAYAEKVRADVPTKGSGAVNRDTGRVNIAKFAEVRAALAAQQRTLGRLHADGRTALENGWQTFYVTMGAMAIVLLITAIVFTLVIRYAVLRPVSMLATQVREVAGGDFERPLGVDRPAELSELSGRVDAMRHRLLDEWRRSAYTQQALADQAAELRRSNGELEQFAYVASHDLQEPLRKVASFTQMLEQRYAAQLDERAKTYIAYAVDGAKRMQLLINDLLDFSRVGRITSEREPLNAEIPLTAALENLAVQIEDSEAVVTHDEMPVVLGSRVLLTQLFQNLIGNALKFRTTDPPRIHISVKAAENGQWEFACTDNGIGIEPKYADRIFLIFQRLHPRDVYPGTGIGLALCRKIVEYHGGVIWLGEHIDEPGTTFRFTLEGAAQ
ncbi:CHASE3 domain-containing protein [Streptosporangiaceae bacterium NEAU-GS5]|nr:CHASE3 domain-containing protein [Streptosporangiaceae bacterium NEAU-GS5]